MGATSSDVLFIDLGVREERVTGIERVHSCGSVVATQIYGNKRKRLRKKRVKLPRHWFGTPTSWT